MNDYIAQKITIHIPAHPTKHAEIEVLNALKILGISNYWAVSGSKLPCVTCGIELHSRGKPVSDVTVVYPFNTPPIEQLKKFMQDSPGTRYGKIVKTNNGKEVTGNRRQSTSSAPDSEEE